MRYKGKYKKLLKWELKQIFKNYQSSDCKLKLIYIKSESLVIVNQHVTVNDLSNFAHTAHHARRIVSAGNLLSNFGCGPLNIPKAGEVFYPKPLYPAINIYGGEHLISC